MEITEDELQARLQQAANAIQDATALLFTSGAGLGVDSGLPDFRGAEGFWKAYPPMKALNLQFPMVSNPAWFQDKPNFAWGFWAHRLKLYRNAEPHYGYEVMKKLGASKLNQDGYFVFTSNVDGAFEKAGYDPARIIECHGSIHWLQCTQPCSRKIWSGEDLKVEVDETTFLAPSPLPTCKSCNALSRPNVLMFYDGQWVQDRHDVQYDNYKQFFSKLTDKSKLVVIEVGAGTAVQTVRYESERRAFEEEAGYKGTLIRINVRDTKSPKDCFAIGRKGRPYQN